MSDAPPDPAWLLQHGRNETSQDGLDGILEKILEILPNTDRWCVEFGAWDGKHCSNTYRLITQADYCAVLFEPDPARFPVLQETYRNYPELVLRNCFVGFEKDDSLDHLLRETPIPTDFDLLSIDIDGNDYHVWHAMESYRPKVVVIEYNASIPTPVDFVQPKDPAVNQGCGVLPLVNLGKEKGYELVCVTTCNAIFVRQEDFALFNIHDNRPETLRRDLSQITHLFFGYDGTTFIDGYNRVSWIDLDLQPEDLQLLPKSKRVFPNNWTKADWKRRKKYYQRLRKIRRFLGLA